MTAVGPRPSGPLDAKQRHRAATDFSSNLVVLAGAGTGKTSLLVERMLNAVGSGLVELDRLAAITFTEKAAGEMRQRLAEGLDRLRELAGDAGALNESKEADRAFRHLTEEAGVTPEDLARRALDAMEQLDRATVCTIHAFCSDLLRAHPFQADVDHDFTVDTGEHADALRETAWEEFLTHELGPQAPRPELWRGVFEEIPPGDVSQIAFALADFGIPEALLREPGGALDTRALFAPLAEELVRSIEDLLARQHDMSKAPLRFFGGVRDAFEALRDGGVEGFTRQVRGDADLAKRLGEGGKPPGMNSKLGGVTEEEATALARRAHRLGQHICGAEEGLIGRVVEAVAPFALAFRESFLRQGFIDFDGLLVLARNLLRDRPAVRRALKQRYRLLLVDEFQDTDPVQYEIVLYLAETVEGSAQTAYLAELEPGRLFVVGDAKQSIYRFRGADYAAYRRAVERIEACGGSVLDLTANFRSVPGVTEPVNAVFGPGSVCWMASDHQPDYVPIAAVRDQPDSDPRVELWSVALPQDAKAEQRREAEGRLIAGEIRRLVDSGESKLEKISILFRSFTDIALYLRPLRELDIPFVVDGGREFLKRPEVAQLMAALRTVAQPADAPALLAFLRSPAGAVPDTELAGYAAGGGRWSYRQEDVDATRYPRIAACFALLRELACETKHLPADAVIRRVVDRTLQLPLGAAAFEGAQRVANVRKLATAAGELARNGRLSLDEVIEALSEGRLQDLETDRPLSDDAAEAVRITSIHRMKGLENDRIFIPDLAKQQRKSGFDSATVKVVRLPDGGQTLAIHVNHRHNLARAWFEADHARHEKAEEVRVLYVALTRARERLVVLAGPARGAAPWVEALTPWGYRPEAPPDDGARLDDGRVLHRLQESGELSPVVAKVAEEPASEAVECYGEALERLRFAAVPPFHAPSGLHAG